MLKKVLNRREDHLDSLRLSMVEDQVARRGVIDARVLDALRKVKRHLFVPDSLVPAAYDDHPLPVGCGQTVSQPYIVGLMSELLELKGEERVLEIGTGTGYQTAVLAELAGEVFTVEFFPELGEQARARLEKLGYRNIKFRTGDGAAGWGAAAPFDAIILTCAPARPPAALTAQLKEGGRLVLPEGPQGVQTLKLLRKNKGAISETEICQVRFVPMQENPDEHTGL